MERKYINGDKAQLKDPEFQTLISKVGVGTNAQIKQAYVLHYHS